jgi:hypothetical protein
MFSTFFFKREKVNHDLVSMYLVIFGFSSCLSKTNLPIIRMIRSRDDSKNSNKSQEFVYDIFSSCDLFSFCCN